MKKIIGSRQTGKTAALLHMSASKHIPILTTNGSNAKLLEARAKEMGIVIPDPIVCTSLDSFFNSHNYHEGVIVDDAEWVLSTMLKHAGFKGIDALSISIDPLDN